MSMNITAPKFSFWFVSDCMVESASGAPTAISGTPLPSISPMPATALPNMSPWPSVMPVEPSPATVFRATVPSAFICMMRNCPWLKLPESGAPAAMSGTPSLSKSPMPATALPNLPPSCSVIPGVASFMLAYPFTLPSRFMNAT